MRETQVKCPGHSEVEGVSGLEPGRPFTAAAAAVLTECFLSTGLSTWVLPPPAPTAVLVNFEPKSFWLQNLCSSSVHCGIYGKRVCAEEEARSEGTPFD